EFFGQVDPRDLPTLYPPTDEDRAQYEPLAQEILNRQGQSGMLEHLMSEIIGLGPLELLLDDAEVEEIYVNSHDQILYRKHDQIITAERAYSHPDFLYLAAQRLMGGRIDDPAASPVDEVRFSDGTRVHILMPPLAPRGPVLTVRKAPRGYRTVEQLVEQGVFSAAIAEFLGHAVTAGRSILIGGVMNTGRDELLNALGNLIPDGTRIVTIEESASLQLAQQSVVSLETGTGHQHHFDMRYLMRSSLRMRPERLLVNSLSGPEAYEWVTAAAGGTVGSMAVCNGVSSRDLLGRLESLCMMGGHDVAPRGLREQIARAVHLVIIMHRQGDGALRVHQISEVQGVDLDTLRVSDIFYFRAEQDGGSFVPTGYVPQFYEALKSAGIPADAGIFQA
ncbi:MAG: ATPase, T2SS/T4P/T4SS family, partial [Myxococcota bacterium]